MKPQKMFQVVFAALLISAAQAALAQAKPATMKLSNDVIKIGVLTDMTGVFSDLTGQGSVAAAQMAIDDFKEQYKPNYKIELIAADHQNKVDNASTTARGWYDTQGVDMITDVVGSAVALAVAKVTQEKKRIAIFTSAATTRLTNEDCTPNTIHYVFDSHSNSVGTGRAITKAGGDTWFFISVDYAFGHSLENDATNAIKAAGGKVLGSVRHPLNAGDFSSFLLQAQASKAKIIGVANAGGDAINTVKTANEFGITKSQSIAGLMLLINEVHALGLATAQGMILTEGFYWDLNDETRAWSKRFFPKVKKMPNLSQAGVYSSTMNYLKAVQATGTDDASIVMKKMKETPINDFFAKNGKIREDGRMVHDMLLVQVKKPSESKYPWDYYHVKAVIPGEEAFQSLALSRCPLIKK